MKWTIRIKGRYPDADTIFDMELDDESVAVVAEVAEASQEASQEHWEPTLHIETPRAET